MNTFEFQARSTVSIWRISKKKLAIVENNRYCWVLISIYFFLLSEYLNLIVWILIAYKRISRLLPILFPILTQTILGTLHRYRLKSYPRINDRKILPWNRSRTTDSYRKSLFFLDFLSEGELHCLLILYIDLKNIFKFKLLLRRWIKYFEHSF